MLINSLHKKQLSEFIKQWAYDEGFSVCGISKAGFLPQEAERVERWLSGNKHAGMEYMQRNKEKRYDPSKLVEKAESVITVLYNYYPRVKLPEKDNYKISKYAYGKDYHYVLKSKLKKILEKIEEKTGKRTARYFTDSAPVLDKAWAARSGLGFIGKNTLLINRKMGSFFFIGHIIIDLELHYDDVEDPANYCGTCKACIEACPTEAIKPFEVDANRCISYLTIEHKGDIPDEFKGKLNDWIFGCDICQDVCPWNIRFSKPHSEPLFNPPEELLEMNKKKWENLDKPTFKKLFKGTPLERPGYKGLMRNINFVKES